MKARSSALLLSSLALASSLPAATLTVGSAAPGSDSFDIAHIVATNDGGAGEKLFTDTRAIGQTFMTGADEVVLNSFTLQTSQNTMGDLSRNREFTISVGTVAGTAYSQIASETAQQTQSSVTGDYFTFTLDAPLTLDPNTEYGFDVAMSSTNAGWQQPGGIPYMYRAFDSSFASGRGFRSVTNGVSTPTIGYANRDLFFHLDLAAVPLVPEPSRALLLTLGLLGILGRRRR